MKVDLGVLGLVEMEEYETSVRYEQGTVYFSGFTEQGIRVHVFIGQGWQHGCMWNNALMLNLGDVIRFEDEE